MAPTPVADQAPPRAAVRHFLTLNDLSAVELRNLLGRAVRLKAGEGRGERPLDRRGLAMIFQKSSTRTRVSFEVGMQQLGGYAVFLSERDTQMGRGEPLADTARVLSGYLDAVMIRTFHQEDVEELARHASIPVINGLTDRFHPCQLLADLQTLLEEFGARDGRDEGDADGRPVPDPEGPRDLDADVLESLAVAWVGDGNNMAHSWLSAAALLGFELRLACPEGYDPDPALVARARERTTVVVTRDPAEAVEGVHAVNTDVWASMGQEGEAEARLAAFRPYQVDEALMARARPEAVFLHCLPAHRGEEVTAGVIDGPRSRVFPQAENRLHAQKALLLHLLT